MTLVIYNAGVLPLSNGMKYIIVWTLQRGVLNPPEQLTDEEAQAIEHYEEASKELAKEPTPWWKRCDFSFKEPNV